MRRRQMGWGDAFLFGFVAMYCVFVVLVGVIGLGLWLAQVVRF